MTRFEGEVVRLLNRFFEDNKIQAIAYRVKQSHFTSQVVDVLVDSPHREYYLAIECKSLTLSTGVKRLYFTQHFTTDKEGIHQIEKISQFIKKSGRTGLVVVELKGGRGHSNSMHVMCWEMVEQKYRSEEVGINIQDIKDMPDLRKSLEDGKWMFGCMEYNRE